MTATRLVIVVAYGPPEGLRATLGALGPDERVVVVDNSSRADVASAVAECRADYVDPGANLGFAAGVNCGVAAAGWDGEDLVLLNPDARIASAGLDRLQDRLHLPGTRIACAAPSQRGTDGLAQRVMWPFPSPARMAREAAGLARLSQPDEFAVGSILVVNGAAWRDVGPLDERYFLYAEEADWQYRARARGWEVRHVPEVEAEHDGSGTSSDEARRQQLFHAGQETFVRTWYGEGGWRSYRRSAIGAARLRARVTGGKGPLQRAELYRQGPRATAGLGDLSPPTTLKITHVVVTDAFAGTERYVCEVSTEQAARGHLVTVIGGNPARMRAALPGSVRWLPGPDLPRAMRSLRAAGWAHVVHTHLTAAELGVLVAGQRGVWVTTRHIAASRGSSPPARLAGRLVARSLDLQLAISDFVAARVEPPSTVLHNGVRNQPHVDAAAREPVVLVAQRLEPEKSTELAVAAWVVSGLAGLGWRLRIAGGGSQAAALTAAVAAAGVGESVELLGQVDDVGAEMRRASILLATAPAEPLGLTVLEAMSWGLPVVAAAGGGHLETLTGAGSTLFLPGDAVGAGAFLAQLAADSERNAVNGRQLRALQQTHFSLIGGVDQLLAHYRELLVTRS